MTIVLQEKSISKSSTFGWFVPGTMAGVSMLVLGFMTDPSTVGSAAVYAEKAGYMGIARVLKNYVLPALGIASTMGMMAGRLGVGDLVTPKGIPGKDREKVKPEVTIEQVAGNLTLGKVIDTTTDVKQTVQAFSTSTEAGLKELKESIDNISQRFLEMPHQFSADDIAHLPSDPRQRAQMTPPPLMGGPGLGEQIPVNEPDTTQTNDGVFLI